MGHPSGNWSLLMIGANLFVCKVPQKDQMSDEKEVVLIVPKSLIAVFWLIAGGLLVISLQFLILDSVNA